jgi:4-amino-4-deoxy-L-arabinose transferase-like glycosyltransferase
LVAGALLALHPALLFYTPAMMTEGVTASILSVALYLALRVRRARDQRRAAIVWLTALGLVVGLATLVRPQSLLVAPVLGALAWRTPRVLRWRDALMRRSCAAVLVTAVTLLVCAPWTARNCVRMKSCALVSVNGGWNLLIGIAPSSTGHWTPIDVPDDCKTVWDEAGKDACFGREARRQIALDKLRYLSLVPRKLAATFDYCGAAPWYLHASSSDSFPWQHKQRLGGLETVFVRLTLLMALLFAAARPGPRRWPRRLVALISAPFLFHVHASVAFVGLLVALALGRSPTRVSLVVGGALAVVGTTALVHAAFFGAGRYSLVALPFVTALGAAALTLTARARDTV